MIQLKKRAIPPVLGKIEKQAAPRFARLHGHSHEQKHKRRASEWASIFLRAKPVWMLLGILACASSAWCQWQDNGNDINANHVGGAEISVTVHDDSGQPISSEALVRIYRGGNTPSGQAATSQGSAVFAVPALGEFTVVVEAAGYQKAQEDISVAMPTRTQADIYLRRDLSAGTSVGVPGRPLLAPKAKVALDKGLEALSAEKMENAVKYLGEAMRLAPGHPDVLYAQGVLYLKQSAWTRAQATLETATQMDPHNARAFAALGMALVDQKKYAASIVPLERALQLNAGAGWETHWALAKAYYQKARYNEALKTSELAVAESQGKAPQIALLVAQSLTAVGKYAEAAQTLRGFVQEHGERPEAATAQSWLERLTESGKIQR